jgi:SH3-like domain-containing protein
MTRYLLLVCLLLASHINMAQALDFKSVRDNAIVYDGGSTKASPVFILLKGTPVEVILTVDKWAKIREQSGGLGWVEQGLISETRQVIVTTPVQVRAQASETAAVVFAVEKNILLEIVEKPSGAWLKVKHRDGDTGYIPIKSVWGI